MSPCLAIALVSLAGAEPPRPAISARIARPDLLDGRVNALFRGASAANPAVALSSWRRATGLSLGKSAEAAITLFNPDSARELAAFDGVLISVGFDPIDGRARWSAVAPRDDGTIDAAVSAMVLTGGASEPPLPAGGAVDRLGMTAGTVLASKFDGGWAIASSREELTAAIERGPKREGPTPIAAGFVVSVDPSAIPDAGTLGRRRVGEALRGSGCLALEASATLDDEAVSLIVTGRFPGPIADGPRVEPAWLEAIPSSEAAAAFAVAVDAGPGALSAAFALIDRVERVDPTRAGVAPSRVRLNLIAAAAGIRPEAELWPALRGVSGFVLGGPSGRFEGAALAIHASDEAAARRIESEVLPRLARSLLRSGPGPIGREAAEGRRFLGTSGGRALLSARRGRTVLVCWGAPALEAALESIARPEKSASMMLRASEASPAPRRFAALWPGRLPGLSPRLASALAASGPATWRGDGDGANTRDEIRWGGLRAAVRRFLDGLPMKAFEG